MGWEKMMEQRGAEAIFGAVIFVGCVVAGAAPASAQTFQSYRCADGTRFLAAFFQYDSRAFLQIDGGAVTLARRLNWTGTRYSGGGITLTITKAGIAVKHARRSSTACEVDVKQP